MSELRDVVGYEEMYAVTKDGRVWSHPRKVRSNGFADTGRWIVQRVSRKYLAVDLSKPGSKRRFFVHRLAAIAWLPNPLGLSEVNHIDGDKMNNNLDNLEWVTRADNLRHSWRTGLRVYTAAGLANTRKMGLQRGTVCRAGLHLFTEENTLHSAKGRRCRQCWDDRQRERLARQALSLTLDGGREDNGSRAVPSIDPANAQTGGEG